MTGHLCYRLKYRYHFTFDFGKSILHSKLGIRNVQTQLINQPLFTMLNYKNFMLALLCLGASSAMAQQRKAPIHKPAPVVSKMDWWRKARFGMFIHWGVYAVPAGVYHGQDVPGLGEWIMQDAKIPVAEYKSYAKDFNPTKYNPEAWVQMAKAAGVKYIVITAKHHDGFALFDSKYSDWNVVKATPYGKDLLKPLAEACRKYGMKLGFYYSQANDWGNKGGAAAFGKWDKAQDGSMDDYIAKVAVPQVREILTNYGDVAELWWDVPTDMTPERAKQFLPAIALQPNIIYNNRLGGDIAGDIETPEQYIPPTGIAGRDWETCMTVNNTWGFKTKDNDWKSAEDLIHNLIDASSKGGNYLLNVGPKADGEIPQPIVERFAAIGKWMNVNNEAIYGTSASPFKKLAWGRCTRVDDVRGTTLYLHVFNWPKDGKLVVTSLQGTQGMKASLLATKQPLKTDTSAEGVVISVPAKALDPIATVIKLYVPGKLKIIPTVIRPNKEGTYVLLADDADVHNPPNNMAMAVEEHDGIFNVGYWTNPLSFVSWTFDIPAKGTYTLTALVGTPDKDVPLEFVLRRAGYTVEMESVTATAYKTGDYQRYAPVPVPNYQIPEPGKYTLIVRPANPADWSPVNLRNVKLELQK